MAKAYAVTFDAKSRKPIITIPEDTQIKAGESYGIYLPIYTRQDQTKFIKDPRTGDIFDVQDMGDSAEDDDLADTEPPNQGDEDVSSKLTARFNSIESVRLPWFKNENLGHVNNPNHFAYKAALNYYLSMHRSGNQPHNFIAR